MPKSFSAYKGTARSPQVRRKIRGGKIFENDIITYVANINASDVPCKGNVFYSEILAAYMVTVKADASHSPDRDNDSYLIPASIPLSECGNLVVIGNVFDGEYELPEKVKNTPFETFLSIAYELDRLAFDIDPYEYQDNEGTESIQTVAENLLHDAYRASVVAMLKEQHRYFSIESAMGQDYANAAERSHSILKRLADIFGEE